MSGALSDPLCEVLPAASVAVTLKAWPLVCGGCKVTLNSPSAPAVAVPSKVPPGPRTCTVAPGSARPVRVVPWLLTANSLGGVGAVVSGALSVPLCEVLPAASVEVTFKAWPLVCGGCRVTLNWPSAPAVAVPKRVPSAPRTCTVEPGSARPVRVVPWLSTANSLGGVGAVVSGAVTVPPVEVLPAGSVMVTVSPWPLFCWLPRSTVNVPSLPTVPVPMRLPAGSNTLTVEPASPRPDTRKPSGETSKSMGVAGGVVSPGWPPPPPPPPPPAAAATPPAPSKPRAAMAKVEVPSPATPIPATS